MLESIIAFFKKLKPEQRQKLLITLIGTLAAVSGLYYGLIRAQMAQLKDQKDAATQYEAQLAEASRLLKMSDSYKKELDDTAAKLAVIEDTMAPPNSDLYAWMFKLVAKFQEGRKVEVLHVSREQACEVGVFPVFPYSAIPANVDGQGQYHEIGKFIADFENQFPYFRVQNLELGPIGGAQSSEAKEKLGFKMEIVALISKTTAPN